MRKSLVVLPLLITLLLSGCYFTPALKEGKMYEVKPIYSRGEPNTFVLSTGEVLICGGSFDKHRYKDLEMVKSPPCEIFNPETNKFKKSTSSLIERYYNGAPLKNGNVIFPGGGSIPYDRTGESWKISELFDREKNKFMMAPKLHFPRHGGVSITLKDGRVLIVGGSKNGGPEDITGNNPEKDSFVYQAEIYDPVKNQYTLTKGKNFKKSYSVEDLILLDDGRVFVSRFPTPEIFDPKTEQFSQLRIKGYLGQGNLVKLRDNKILIIAASDWIKKQSYLDTESYILDLNNNILRKIESPKTNQAKYSTAYLSDNRVLLISDIISKRENLDWVTYILFGGLKHIAVLEIFDPKTEQFSELGTFDYPIWQPTLVHLKKGNRVLILFDPGNAPFKPGAFIYEYGSLKKG